MNRRSLADKELGFRNFQENPAQVRSCSTPTFERFPDDVDARLHGEPRGRLAAGAENGSSPRESAFPRGEPEPTREELLRRRLRRVHGPVHSVPHRRLGRHSFAAAVLDR